MLAFGGENDAADASDHDSFAIHPDNWDAIQVFCAASTQWRWYESHRLGLIYSELNVLMAIYKINDKRDCLERLRILEREVLDASAT